MAQYSANLIANAFLAKAHGEHRALTNMQLQKLVYFANGWSLALWAEPLIKEKVKAWNFGPVIPPLYNSLKRYGNGEVTERIDVPDDVLDERTSKLIDRVWSSYGHLSGSQLSALTHLKDSAWKRTYDREKFAEIDDKLIAEEFKKQMV